MRIKERLQVILVFLVRGEQGNQSLLEPELPHTELGWELGVRIVRGGDLGVGEAGARSESGHVANQADHVGLIGAGTIVVEEAQERLIVLLRSRMTLQGGQEARVAGHSGVGHLTGRLPTHQQNINFYPAKVAPGMLRNALLPTSAEPLSRASCRAEVRWPLLHS